LALTPQDRVALVGPNGGGKSTLMRHLIERLTLPSDKLVYLPQEIGRDVSLDIVRQVRRLTNQQLGALMGIVGALGSQPDRLIQTDEPSPGEIRKLLLALGMSRRPELIVMDEPTNHLDLPSIECMEKALADCPSALLLVSHDERFLAALASRRWLITFEAPDRTRLSIVQHGT
jgi:ATPase subunit of ABC transporter with duplicated ATPase domains